MATTISGTTLSPFPLAPNPNPRQWRPAAISSERGVPFTSGSTFFRPESSTARDLAVLSAALHQKNHPQIRILDSMCGCGVRSLRYLAQSKAHFVHANDANEDTLPLILQNLQSSGVPRVLDSGERRWVVTHFDANRVLAESFLNKQFFDLVDVDSFGSDSSFVRMGLLVVHNGGLLYLTSTDGYSSGGHRPHCTLASYGAYVRPMPFSNEIGLRMLIGGALREASVLGYHVKPLFSYYSYHGPVFRVMLQVNRGPYDRNQFGFVTYCHRCGNSETFCWEELGQITCPCTMGQVSKSIVVSGPLWIGPLHDSTYVSEMLALASGWGWTGTSDNGVDLGKLLNQMIDESDPQLPPGYIKLDEIASRAKIHSPPVASMISILKKEGYVACRSHITPIAIKTNCKMADCIILAQQLRQEIQSGIL